MNLHGLGGPPESNHRSCRSRSGIVCPWSRVPWATRIAAYRRRRGLSQAALAGLVGRNESWLSQVERGVRSVDRLSVLLDLSRVLHVDVQSLIGRPWNYAPNGDPAVDGLAEIRAFFTSYDDLLGVQSIESESLAVVRTSIARAHRTYQAACYHEVIIDIREFCGRWTLSIGPVRQQTEKRPLWVTCRPTSWPRSLLTRVRCHRPGHARG